MLHHLNILFGDGGAKDFVKNYLGIKPLHKSLNCEQFFSLQNLEEIIEKAQVSWPQLRLVKDGKSIPESEYTNTFQPLFGEAYKVVSSSGLHQLLLNGSTLVIDRVDELSSDVKEIAETLERYFDCSVFINAYYTVGKKSKGFNLHWDDHDVIIIQVQGEKSWSFHKPTRSWPLFIDADETNEPERKDLDSIITAPGDLFYIPHGWWHDAVAESDSSLHLSIGIRRSNGLDLLNWMIPILSKFEALRVPIPSSENDRVEYLSNVVNILSKHMSSTDLIHEFIKETNGNSYPRPKLALSTIDWKDEDYLLCNYSLIGSRGRLEHNEDSVHLLLAGNKWSFSKICAEALDILISGRSIVVKDLVKSGFSESVAIKFVIDLVEAGVLSVSIPSLNK